MKTLNVSLVILVSLIQLAVPASMLWNRERTLRDGAVYRFRAEPVDPYDAFRGRYVRINVGAMEAPWIGEPSAAERCFAVLARDAEGYATVIAARATRPDGGEDFVRARYWRMGELDRVRVVLPIERFYMPDPEAPAAEMLYRAHATRGASDAVVVARVRHGDLVIEDVLIDDLPLREHVRSASNSKSESESQSNSDSDSDSDSDSNSDPNPPSNPTPIPMPTPTPIYYAPQTPHRRNGLRRGC